MARALPKSPYVSDILLALVLGTVLVNTPILRRLFGLALPSHEREADRYASGLRFTGKWVLRAAIILMGLEVHVGFFGAAEVALIFSVVCTTLPSAFFIAHALGTRLGLRRPMADLLAGGTMICGSSAVNAIAPVVGARVFADMPVDRDSTFSAEPGVPIVEAIRAEADAQGRYTLRGVGPGLVGIFVSTPLQGFGGAATARKTVRVAPSQDLTSIDLTLPALAEISGRIVDENDDQHRQDRPADGR